MKKSTLLLAMVVCLLLGTTSILAGPASYLDEAQRALPSPHEQIPEFGKAGLLQTALSIDGAVDFDLAQTYGADYLRGMQADITEDNAGNGNPDVPDDPDDGGWDWSTTAFSHSTSASPTNIYGATAMGLYYTYLEAGGVGYLIAMTDAADTMANNANVRSGADLVFLMLYNDLAGVSGTTYKDAAKAKYDSRISTYGSAQLFAEYIRDVRGVTHGYPNGIIAWDIGIWARVAAMLDARYPGNGYDTDADDIAEVLYQDSYMDNPGYFDIVDDAGWDPTYTDKNFWWYNLGITGLIDAFDAAGVHTSEIPGLVTLLLDGQANHGGISFSYGANIDDHDWQSTAYAMMTLGLLDQSTYQSEINEMGYFLAATQDASGAWVYSSGNHYPEIGGESTAGLYFTTNTTTYDLADAIVDDDFTGQGEVDVYNNANGTNYIWGYDAFATIQEAIDAVDGSTVYVQPGTYVASSQIVIDKDLTLIGAGKTLTTIEPGFNTTVGNYLVSDALVYVDYGNTVTIEDLAIDGTGYTVRHAIQSRGAHLTVTGCDIRDIYAGTYYGRGVVFLTGTGLVEDCSMSNIQRIGVHVRGSVEPTAPDVDVDGLTYTGKGAGDWLDYGVEFGGGGTGSVENSTITNCLGVADSDGSTSAAILATDYYGTGTNATITSCTLTGNSTGIYAGYTTGDATVVVAHYNDLSGNDLGVSSVTAATLDAELNYWGTVDYTTILGKVSGDVDFDPWCNDASHTICTLTYPVTDTWVDDDWAGSSEGDIVGGHVYGYDAFATVQEGVDHVTGSTVHIAAGTYVEQVHVTTDNLVLEGSGVGVTTIQSPASLTEYFVTGTNNNYPVVFVDGAGNVTITDLTVDGAQLGNANYRFVGIGFWNGDGTVDGVEVINIMDNPFSGSQHGVGIYSYNDDGGPYSIALQAVDVYDFQKNAIALLGAGLTVDLDNVTTTGAGATSVTAQNGIQIGSGVSGTVDNCEIYDVAYTGGNWTATGFLNEGAVAANGVDIDGCQTGVYWIDGSGSFAGGTITNPLGDGFYAYNSTTAKGTQPKLMAQPFDADQATGSAKTVMNVSLTNTTITGTGATDSWGVGAFSTSTDPVNFTMTGCTIDNWDYGYVAYDYGGPVTSAVNGNAFTNCTYGMVATGALAVQDGTQNWWGTFDPSIVQSLIDGNVAYSPWWGDNYLGDPHTSPWIWWADNSGLIQTAIDLATAGDTIYLAAGSYAEGPQIVADKDITIIGESAKSLVTITPTANTGSSGDARGWFLVNDGVTLNFSNVTLDGAGYDIYQAIRCKGGGVFSYIDFQNITYPSYAGVAIAVFPGTLLPTTIDHCDFANIGRVGALIWYATAQFTNNTYTGKGDGDWLDYAVDMNSGATVTANGNTITNCTGVASSDGSTSAGLLITTYYGAGTSLMGEDNNIKYCTSGLAIGYDGSDGSTVSLTGGNVFIGNDYGITTTASSGIGLTVYGNTFSNTVNAEDNTAGGSWDDGASVGNCWSDFASNSGYPTNYVVDGTAGAIDNYPNTDCGITFGPDEIVYDCDGDFTVDVGVGDAVVALEAVEMTLEYPAELTLGSVTAADANFFMTYSLTDNASGTDVLLINLGVQTGWLDGAADLFTVTLSGATPYCTGSAIAMSSAELRDTANAVIAVGLPDDLTLFSDCEDPVLTIDTAEGGCWNAGPVVNLEASDDCDLDAIYYQIDGCAAGGWNLLAGSLTGSTYGPNDYVMGAADFVGLSEGTHCLYFKVIDDFGHGNPDSCDCWEFIKDTAPPAAPTDLVATPGHNKVELSWTNVGSDFDHVVVMRSDWNGSGHGYPEYGSPDNGTAEGSYPTDTTSFDLVYSGTGNTLTDTDDISNTTRDVYHYTVFTVDCAGNLSTPTVDCQSRATSYWLGDVAGSGGPGDYDGYVYSQDLSVFSFAYWTGPLATTWNAECDFAPTEVAKAGPRDIPVPDDSVEFEDLVIFAINYDDVSPASAKDRPIFSGTPYSSQTCLRLKGRVEGNHYLVDILLDNMRDLAKAVDVVLRFDQSTLKYIATEPGADLRNAAQGVFFQTKHSAEQIYLSAAVLGEGLTFTGSGTLATLRFELGQSGNSSVEIASCAIRGVNNEDVDTGTPVAAGLADVEIPSRFTLEQNSPNPFNPITEIAYGLPAASHVTLKVYNITGQVVKTLVDSYQQAGRHTVRWDATNDYGRRVASGVYFYRFETAEFQKTVKMTLLK